MFNSKIIIKLTQFTIHKKKVSKSHTIVLANRKVFFTILFYLITIQVICPSSYVTMTCHDWMPVWLIWNKLWAKDVKGKSVTTILARCPQFWFKQRSLACVRSEMLFLSYVSEPTLTDPDHPCKFQRLAAGRGKTSHTY